jgi:hypothetical protein
LGEHVFGHAKSGRGFLHAENALRREPDPDPLVEAATERLRQELTELTAVDRDGRLLAWREVVRLVLEDLASPRVRDAVTADVLSESLVPVKRKRSRPAVGQRAVSPEETYQGPEWRTYSYDPDAD